MQILIHRNPLNIIPYLTLLQSFLVRIDVMIFQNIVLEKLKIFYDNYYANKKYLILVLALQ